MTAPPTLAKSHAEHWEREAAKEPARSGRGRPRRDCDAKTKAGHWRIIEKEIRRFSESDRRGQANANFDIAQAELRKLGISLLMRPQPRRYYVNFEGDPTQCTRTARNLCDAVELGIDMAKGRVARNAGRKSNV